MKKIPLKTITVADQMISLYAEYVEGFIDRSKEKYNHHFENISNTDIIEMIVKTHWDSHVINLYDCLIERMGKNEAFKFILQDKSVYERIKKAYLNDNEAKRKAIKN